ncbi:MAG: GHKL domain-containing protein, partial [Lachnospiraceae bacterium]|nr:GHKL domain-containing protein [Lachnospiraceae bacterium]
MMSVEILNTPGYYYAIAYWLSAFMIVCIYRNRFRGWISVALDGAAFISLLIFMHLTDNTRKWLFIPLMFVVISFTLWYVYYSCRFSLIEIGYFGAKIIINAEFAGSFCWQIYYNFIGDIPAQYLNIWRWAEMIFVFGLIFTGVHFMERYLKRDMEELKISRRELLGILLIVLVVFSVSNMSYLNRNWLFSGILAKDIFIIRTLVDLCGILLLYAYHIQVKEVQLRFEMDTLQNIMEMQYSNYQLSKESIDMVNQKYHDLKHQIALLKSETDMHKSVQYLEQIEKEIKIYEAQNKTGNKVLDTVLTSKSAYCQSVGIELKCVVEGALLGFMDDMDISALFGNMLDNAIEAVQKLPDKERRLIRLYVVQEKQFLRICTENYCEEKIVFKNGMPVTTKKNKRIHGYGMKSIQNTVKKYDGSVVAKLN